MDGQPKFSTKKPPTKGPIAVEKPITEPKIPSAVPRSRPSKFDATSAIDKLIIPEPPIAWTARPISNTNKFGASPLTTEAAVNKIILMTKNCFAPEHVP